jgi:hypothetical protein
MSVIVHGVLWAAIAVSRYSLAVSLLRHIVTGFEDCGTGFRMAGTGDLPRRFTFPMLGAANRAVAIGRISPLSETSLEVFLSLVPDLSNVGGCVVPEPTHPVQVTCAGVGGLKSAKPKPRMARSNEACFPARIV